MEHLLDTLSPLIGLIEGDIKWLGGLLFIVGLVYLLAGHKFWNFMLWLTGFIAGCALGAVVGLFAVGTDSYGVIIVVCGIIGGVVAQFLHSLCVFLIGAILGAGLSDMIGFPEAVNIILGIIGGILAMALEKLIIIIGTSFTGACLIAVGTAVSGGKPPGSFGVFLITVVGIAVQYGAIKFIEKYKNRGNTVATDELNHVVTVKESSITVQSAPQPVTTNFFDVDTKKETDKPTPIIEDFFDIEKEKDIIKQEPVLSNYFDI